MKYKDEELYQEWMDKNKGTMGESCVRFAKTWAEAMEEEIEKGVSVAEAANNTHHLVKETDMTWFAFGSTCHVLWSTWHYGKELETWCVETRGMKPMKPAR